MTSSDLFLTSVEIYYGANFYLMELFQTRTNMGDQLDWVSNPLLSRDFKGPQIIGSTNYILKGAIGECIFQHLADPNLREFSLFYNYYYLHGARTFHTKAASNSCEITIMLGASAAYTLFGKQQYELSYGKYTFSYLPYIDSKVILPGKKAIETLDIHFTRSYLETTAKLQPLLLNHILEKMDTGKPFQIDGNIGLFESGILDMIPKLINCLKKEKKDYPLIANHVQNILFTVLNSAKSNKSKETVELNKKKEQIDKVWRLYEDNLYRYPSQISLIRATRMSPKELNKICKELNNCTLNRFLNSKKMREIAKVIITTGKTRSHSDIAIEYNFPNLSQLTRAFIDEFKMTPTQYKNYHLGL